MLSAEQTIDQIIEILSKQIEITYPEFHSDGSSTYIVYGKDALDKLFEISNIVKQYKKETKK